MIEWTYYNAENYRTYQELAERTQIVAGALDKGLRIERRNRTRAGYEPSEYRSNDQWRPLACAAREDFDIRIGREVPELECWGWVQDGEICSISMREFKIREYVANSGGECVRFVPEGK